MGLHKPSSAPPSPRSSSSPSSLPGPSATSASSTPSSPCAATSAPSSSWATVPAPAACRCGYYHPFQDAQQLRDYASLGEVRYVARQSAAVRAFIAAHPAHFLTDVARRVYFFWAGVPHPADEAWYNEVGRTLNFAFISLAGLFGLALALRNRVPAAGLIACAFLLLPIPYYIVTVHARFRHPLEPLIAILGVYLFQSATKRGAKNELSS